MTAEKRQYYATRKHFRPVVGKVYENEGGCVFRCLPASEYYSDYNAVLVNILSGWTFAAHGIGLYIDDRIDWDYSTDGYFWRDRSMTHRFVVRMSEEQFNLLQEMAEINCSSVNKLINVAIDEMLKKYQMIDEMDSQQ